MIGKDVRSGFPLPMSPQGLRLGTLSIAAHQTSGSATRDPEGAGNGYALEGLRDALLAQDRKADAEALTPRIAAAWAYAER